MEKKSTPTSKKKESVNISLNSILIWLILIGIVVYIIIDVTKTHTKDDDVPVGTIVAFPSSSPPKGYLPCDGSAIPGKYSALIKLVGKATPDLRQMFIRGWSDGKTILGTAEATTSAKNLKIPDHTHSMLSWTGPGGSGQPGGGGIFYASQANGYSTSTGIRNVANPKDQNASAIQFTTLTISGDAETAPQHIFIPFYIKCG